MKKIDAAGDYRVHITASRAGSGGWWARGIARLTLPSTSDAITSHEIVEFADDLAGAREAARAAIQSWALAQRDARRRA